VKGLSTWRPRAEPEVKVSLTNWWQKLATDVPRLQTAGSRPFEMKPWAAVSLVTLWTTLALIAPGNSQEVNLGIVFDKLMEISTWIHTVGENVKSIKAAVVPSNNTALYQKLVVIGNKTARYRKLEQSKDNWTLSLNVFSVSVLIIYVIVVASYNIAKRVRKTNAQQMEEQYEIFEKRFTDRMNERESKPRRQKSDKAPSASLA
jgi:hypothetical protein